MPELDTNLLKQLIGLQIQNSGPGYLWILAHALFIAACIEGSETKILISLGVVRKYSASDLDKGGLWLLLSISELDISSCVQM